MMGKKLYPVSFRFEVEMDIPALDKMDAEDWASALMDEISGEIESLRTDIRVVRDTYEVCDGEDVDEFEE